jgi:hypothetical protein
MSFAACAHSAALSPIAASLAAPPLSAPSREHGVRRCCSCCIPVCGCGCRACGPPCACRGRAELRRRLRRRQRLAGGGGGAVAVAAGGESVAARRVPAQPSRSAASAGRVERCRRVCSLCAASRGQLHADGSGRSVGAAQMATGAAAAALAQSGQSVRSSAAPRCSRRSGRSCSSLCVARVLLRRWRALCSPVSSGATVC